MNVGSKAPKCLELVAPGKGVTKDPSVEQLLEVLDHACSGQDLRFEPRGPQTIASVCPNMESKKVRVNQIESLLRTPTRTPALGLPARSLPKGLSQTT